MKVPITPDTGSLRFVVLLGSTTLPEMICILFPVHTLIECTCKPLLTSTGTKGFSVSVQKMTNLAKQAESLDAKKKHMQAFVDKFRFNAKRASLVQSRLKAIDRLGAVQLGVRPHHCHCIIQDLLYQRFSK